MKFSSFSVIVGLKIKYQPRCGSARPNWSFSRPWRKKGPEGLVATKKKNFFFWMLSSLNELPERQSRREAGWRDEMCLLICIAIPGCSLRVMYGNYSRAFKQIEKFLSHEWRHSFITLPKLNINWELGSHILDQDGALLPSIYKQRLIDMVEISELSKQSATAAAWPTSGTAASQAATSPTNTAARGASALVVYWTGNYCP